MLIGLSSTPLFLSVLASTSPTADEPNKMFPLTSSSPQSLHTFQNTFLLLLSLIFLPLDTLILAISYAFSTLSTSQSPTKPRTSSSSSKTILVTGVGMTKGLVLARLFSTSGHRVIGADFSSASPGRFSRSLSKFYRLEKPTAGSSGKYIRSLVSVILREKVDIWVSCSGVASAVEDGEAKEIVEEKTGCKAIQFDVGWTKVLHEKDSFIEATRKIGLNVLETYTITRREEVEEALKKAQPGRKFIMKTIGMNDAARGEMMTLLPKGTEEETKEHLSGLAISEKEPWILQQFVRGEEFCTHSLVVKGVVKAFVACPSSDLLMHYAALPPETALSKAMLSFTQTWAKHGGENFTGHLSFDFFVEDTTPKDPERIVLYPIECNPRAHTAVCLFNGTPELVDGYLDVLLDRKTNEEYSQPIVIPVREGDYYWIGHDLVTLILLPLLQVVMLQLSPTEFLKALRTFLVHLATWKDGTYELWDPMPWWMLYHVYWPMQFIECLMSGKRWSRLNVSTLKMFEC